MVILHKPASSHNEPSKMRYWFNCLRGVALAQILPPIREDGTIGLADLPGYVQLLDGAFGDPDRVATTERHMCENQPKDRMLSQYCAELQVMAADVDWDPSALWNDLRIGSSNEMKG